MKITVECEFDLEAYNVARERKPGLNEAQIKDLIKDALLDSFYDWDDAGWLKLKIS